MELLARGALRLSPKILRVPSLLQWQQCRGKKYDTPFHAHVSKNRHIYVHHLHRDTARAQNTTPAIVYLPGFMRHTSDIEVQFLANHCIERGYEAIFYDPEGFGMSSGTFETTRFR